MSVLVVRDAEGPLPILVDATISNLYQVFSSRPPTSTDSKASVLETRSSDVLYVMV